MEQKLNDAKALGLRPSTVLEESPTRFYSNAKAPLFMLSNLYACECDVNGLRFPSAEHAYQALQKISGPLTPWLSGGLFSNWSEVYRIVNEDRASKGMKPLSDKKWKKKNQIGILAILVIRRPQLFQLDMKPRNDALSISYEERWRPIFQAKYQTPALQKVLLSTKGPLIEFKRGAHREMIKVFYQNLKAGVSYANDMADTAELWGAFNNGLEVWGQNVTGKNLTRFRDELLNRKRAHSGEPAAKRAKFKTYTTKQ